METEKSAKDLLGLSVRNIHGPAFDDFALGVAGGSAFAQLQDRFVRLRGIKEKAGKLGRLAECQWQQPAGEGIEGSGMSSLACAKQPLCLA